MAQPVHAPRVNNNDDVVKVARICVQVGDAVAAGDLLMELETEKATVDVEAESDGYVLAVACEQGQDIAVGAVALWLGATPDEAPPQASAGPVTMVADSGMTAKARLLLRRHALSAGAVPRTAARLTAADVEAYLALHPPAASSAPTPRRSSIELPAPAETSPLSSTARGMLATVTWQRDHAAAAYLELEYDPRPWEAAAAAFMRERRLLFSPLLSLMAHRLAQFAHNAGANATVLEGETAQLVRYKQANLGFTVQAGEVLYFCVVNAADTLAASDFVHKLFYLQRRAMGHNLTSAEMRGATIGFTSMARWGVRRHQPVLAPNTGVMIAHSASAPDGESAILGMTYDHRLLSGFDAVRLLKTLTQPGSY